MDATERRRGKFRRWMGFILLAVVAFGAMAGGAAAHRDADHGTVTWHDSEDGEPQSHTEGKYSEGAVELHCEFWVKGYNVSHAEGDIAAEFNYRSGNPDVTYIEVAGNWSGETNESGGYDFVAGPFAFEDDGLARGFATVGETAHDKDHRSQYEHATEDHRISYEACEDEGDQDQPPACPGGLHAEAHGNENVSLSWNASADADTYQVYRASADGTFEHVAQVNDTAYTDTETEADTTYTYETTAANEVGEAEDCPTVEVTAIPFFGNPALLAMAGLGSLGAVAALRIGRS